MEKLTVKREFTHKKGDRSKGKPVWSDLPDKPEMVDNKETGYKEIWYNVTAANIGAEKVVGYREISMPTTADECASLDGETLLRLVRLGNLTEQERALSKDLMDTYESEEKKARRYEKAVKDAKAALGTFMESFLAAGKYPTQEEFVKKVAEVSAEFGVDLTKAPASA